MGKLNFVPCTPGGSLLMHLSSRTRAVAIKKLMKEISHMPCKDWRQAAARGYDIVPMADEYKRRKNNKQDIK